MHRISIPLFILLLVASSHGSNAGDDKKREKSKGSEKNPKKEGAALLWSSFSCLGSAGVFFFIFSGFGFSEIFGIASFALSILSIVIALGLLAFWYRGG
ncbi:MAG: hypothetical protein AAB288_13770 [Acidobacteriota bacterium]